MPEPSRRGVDRRVEQLAVRVRWLDRYRRFIAISAATIASPLLIAQVAGSLGAAWPQIHATVLSVMLGVIVWWVVEVCLVYITALWETEHDRLLRDHSLPRAVVLRIRPR